MLSPAQFYSEECSPKMDDVRRCLVLSLIAAVFDGRLGEYYSTDVRNVTTALYLVLSLKAYPSTIQLIQV